MFRLNRFMRELVEPTPVRRQQPPGPVVIWNLVRRCNLNCKHCYSLSADVDFPGELSTEEVFTVMDDLRGADVDFVTIGQYLRPSPRHAAVERYWAPEEFVELSRVAEEKGFLLVSASPMTRSSYHADEDFQRLRARRH